MAIFPTFQEGKVGGVRSPKLLMGLLKLGLMLHIQRSLRNESADIFSIIT